MTQQQLSDYLGKKNKNTISSWENNRNVPTIHDIKKLAKLYDVSYEYLLDDPE